MHDPMGLVCRYPRFSGKLIFACGLFPKEDSRSLRTAGQAEVLLELQRVENPLKLAVVVSSCPIVSQ